MRMEVLTNFHLVPSTTHKQSKEKLHRPIHSSFLGRKYPASSLPLGIHRPIRIEQKTHLGAHNSANTSGNSTVLSLVSGGLLQCGSGEKFVVQQNHRTQKPANLSLATNPPSANPNVQQANIHCFQTDAIAPQWAAQTMAHGGDGRSSGSGFGRRLTRVMCARVREFALGLAT